MTFWRLPRTSAVYLLLLGIIALIIPNAAAQTANSGTVSGTVQDPSGGAIPGADVTIANAVSGYQREMTTDAMGQFSFSNLPFNPYHLVVTVTGFAAHMQDVDVRSSVPIDLKVGMILGAAAGTSVTVTAEQLVENTPTNHTDIDRNVIDKLPLESQSSEVSSLVTLASPGVAADSNGLFHGLGDHAENSFAVDGQPITDQQSKVFSNQIPADSIQSLEVIEGAPPAEYGGKTSLVIDVTTRSGLGVKQPTGEVVGSFGSFDTGNGSANLAWGGDTWGNFVAVSEMNTDRFLDPPEFAVMHDGGDEQNLFDRVDYKITKNDTISLDFNYTRSWFQTPNSFDMQNSTAWTGLDGGTVCLVVCNGGLGPDGKSVPPANQRSLINTLNIAPTWTHIINASALFSLGFWTRGDQYTYSPSQDPFSDLAPDLQGQSIGQYRTLTNIGERGTFSYSKGIHNIKAGVSFEQTLLHEDDSFAIVDPGANAPCLVTATGAPDTNPSVNNYEACPGSDTSNPNFIPILGCYDLSRTAPLPADDDCPAGQDLPQYYGGFNHNTDIKEFAVYVEDSITVRNTHGIPGSWNFNVGMRGDIYSGLTHSGQAEPRLGVAYNIQKTGTVLRISYAHTLESPFNENLILSSIGCADPVVNQLMAVTQGIPCTTAPLSPGIRNEYHAGLEQAFGKYFVLSGEYIWKYTHHGYDFSVLGASPITFPVEWTKSNIPGFTVRGSLPNFHGLSAFIVMSSVAARFYPPTISGITPLQPPGVFRIDHDERYNQTTHIQYQPFRALPWIGFNWRYDSGLVAGAVPCAGGEDCPNGPGGTDTVVSVLNLTPDQQFEAGLFCGSLHATPTIGISSGLGYGLCPASEYGSTLLSIPAPGTENDDHNPQRVAARHLFDLAVGEDDLFGHWRKNERYKWSAKLTIVNLANTTALYNFLSTFSGTHYVTPRTVTGELGFHF